MEVHSSRWASKHLPIFLIEVWLNHSTLEFANETISISDMWGSFMKAWTLRPPSIQSCCFLYILHLTSVRLFKLPDSQNKRTTYFSKLVTVRPVRSSVTPKSQNTSSIESRKAFQQVALDFPLNLLVWSQPEKAWNPKSAFFSGPKTSYATPTLILWLPDSNKTKTDNRG